MKKENSVNSKNNDKSYIEMKPREFMKTKHQKPKQIKTDRVKQIQKGTIKQKWLTFNV